MESVIGPEIFSSPVQHTRMKPPDRLVPRSARSIVSKTPWHQDQGVALPDADNSTILTVWIPANEATVANGCLELVPGSHRRGLVDHCPRFENGRKGLAIPSQLIDLDRVTALPMRPGSVLLLNQRTMHGSLANTTPDEVRISFDLRYLPVGQPDGSAQTERGFVARSAADPQQRPARSRSLAAEDDRRLAAPARRDGPAQDPRRHEPLARRRPRLRLTPAAS